MPGRRRSAARGSRKAADLVEQAVHETLTYYGFPDIHWQKIRTNNPLERIMKEIRRRTRVVGAFPDGQSCLNLAAARLRYIAGTTWSAKCYMNMRPLYQQRLSETEAVACSNVRKILDTTGDRHHKLPSDRDCYYFDVSGFPVRVERGRSDIKVPVARNMRLKIASLKSLEMKKAREIPMKPTTVAAARLTQRFGPT